MSRPVIVIGSGGHAKVVIAALQRSGAEILGITDKDRGRALSQVLGVPVLGDDRVLEGYEADTVALVNGVGSTGSSAPRRRVFESLRKMGFRFAVVVHPAAVVAPDTGLGEGAQVMAGAVIQPGCQIGANAIVNTGAGIDHDCAIGDHAHVAPGAVLCGSVVVGNGAHVGAGTTVTQNVTIPPEALVRAGSLVTRSPAGAGARIRAQSG